MGDVDHVESVVETLIARARVLTDADRWELARARGAVDEVFHVGAWKAAGEMVATRAGAYVASWVRIGGAFVPDRLKELLQMGSGSDPEEVRQWQEVARLTRLGIDDALLALFGADSIPPPDIRELHRPWKEMLEAAHAREAAS